MNIKNEELKKTGEFWNGLNAVRQSEFFRKMLKSSDPRDKPNFIDYSHGAPVRFEQLRPSTQWAIVRMRRKGGDAYLTIE